jgi:uncharacterized protein YdeI (BOF family)
MKANLLLRNILVLTGLAMVSLLNAQTPKSVCQIKQAPVNRDHVVTPGIVESVSGDDFFLRDGDCSIECDVNDGVATPGVGDEVVVYGYVELDDDDPAEIDVYTWKKEGGTAPQPPTASVETVEAANAAVDGTYAELTGAVTSWTEESDGEGVFADNTGSINIDFEGNKPAISDNIILLGRVTTDDGAKEIDVYSFYPAGGIAPEGPMDVVFTVAEANAAPIGSYAYVDGVLDSWLVDGDEGMLKDGSESIKIDFDGDGSRPQLDDDITVLGIVDDDNGTKEIEVYDWDMAGDATSIADIKANAVSIYPNPAQDYLIISSEESFTNVKLVSSDGRIVLDQSARNKESISLRSVSTGNYILILSDGNKAVGVNKIIVAASAATLLGQPGSLSRC